MCVSLLYEALILKWNGLLLPKVFFSSSLFSIHLCRGLWKKLEENGASEEVVGGGWKGRGALQKKVKGPRPYCVRQLTVNILRGGLYKSLWSDSPMSSSLNNLLHVSPSATFFFPPLIFFFSPFLSSSLRLQSLSLKFGRSHTVSL